MNKIIIREVKEGYIIEVGGYPGAFPDEYAVETIDKVAEKIKELLLKDKEYDK